jgi:transposase-like protein
MAESEVIMPAGTRRRYSEEFTMEAVRLVRDSARLVAQVARELGILGNVLHRWRAEQRHAEAHGTTWAAQRAEA